MYRALLPTALSLTLMAQLTAQSAVAAGPISSLTFVAAEPSSYDHFTGGGAYNDRTINADVVESIEGGDFACGHLVTFLTQIQVDAGAFGELERSLH